MFITKKTENLSTCIRKDVDLLGSTCKVFIVYVIEAKKKRIFL